MTARASTVRRKALRRRLHHELLRHLVTVADIAAVEQPGLAERHELPSDRLTNEGFRTHARRLLEQGRKEKDVLVPHGLADSLLDDLAATVDEFDRSVAQSNEGRRGHVGARAELKALSDELMLLVAMLDGLNRYASGSRLNAEGAASLRVSRPAFAASEWQWQARVCTHAWVWQDVGGWEGDCHGGEWAVQCAI